MSEGDPAGRGQPGNVGAGADLAHRIGRRINGLLKEFYGRGADRLKTYVEDDAVLVLLSGGHTRADETLIQAGRGDQVSAQRDAFQEAMRKRFLEAVEQETGRSVIAFLSANQERPDLMCEVFVLEPTDLVEAGEDEPA